MYNYQDVEKISGVKSKITKRILKKQKMNHQTNFNDKEVKIIISEVEKYEKRQSIFGIFKIIMVLMLIKIYI